MRRKIYLAFIAVMLSTMVASAQSTDISDRDNVIYVENATAKPGQQVTLSVNMNNTLAVRGFQFDLYLPDGISVAKDDDGFLKVELSTVRTTSKKMNYFDYDVQEDGALRVLCTSTGTYTFDGNSGEVCTIMVDIDNGLSGDFDLSLRNVILTDPDAVRYPIDGTQSVITVKDCDCGVYGDMNGDGIVSITDITRLVQLVLTGQ